jgi:hypothetical protein
MAGSCDDSDEISHALAQAVSCWFIAAVARVQSLSMWDLGCTELHWDRFFEYLGFVLVTTRIISAIFTIIQSAGRP